MLNPDAVQLPEPKTPLYPLIQRRVAEAARPLAERLGAWRMMNARASLQTTDFAGKPVNYQGVMFDGTPQVVFWSDFFEPFMVDTAQQSLEWVIQTCHDRNLDAKEYISETTELLNVLVAEAYEEMARTDQLLRGRGDPDSVSPRPVGHKIDAMKKRIGDLSAALTHRGLDPFSRTAEACMGEQSAKDVGRTPWDVLLTLTRSRSFLLWTWALSWLLVVALGTAWYQGVLPARKGSGGEIGQGGSPHAHWWFDPTSSSIEQCTDASLRVHTSTGAKPIEDADRGDQATGTTGVYGSIVAVIGCVRMVNDSASFVFVAGPDQSDAKNKAALLRTLLSAQLKTAKAPPAVPASAGAVKYVSESSTTIPCDGGNCGGAVLIFKYVSGPEAQGGDRETGLTKCLEANAKPIVVVQAVAISSPAHGIRHNIAVCTK